MKTKESTYQHKSGRNTILSSDQESKLVGVVIMLNKRGFPLSWKDIQALAFEFANRNDIKGFSENKQKAGRYWFEGFLQRHPQLGNRKPENLSLARAAGMNETVVSSWFEEYMNLAMELDIVDKPDRLLNCDESGLQDQLDQGFASGEVGKPCYRITPGEKGETMTVLACFSVCEEFAPPMVIFKGKRVRPEWAVGSPIQYSE